MSSAHRLVAPHHIGRAHRLVRRNQDKILDALGQRDGRNVAGAQNIVADALDRIGLYQRNVLVGRGMKQHLHAMPANGVLDTALVGNRPQNGDNGHILGRPELALDLIEGKLTAFKQHQALRRPPDDQAT